MLGMPLFSRRTRVDWRTLEAQIRATAPKTPVLYSIDRRSWWDGMRWKATPTLRDDLYWDYNRDNWLPWPTAQEQAFDSLRRQGDAVTITQAKVTCRYCGREAALHAETCDGCGAPL